MSTAERTPRKHLRLSDEAANHVRERILAGELAAGTFMRPEVVADELGISATPAREGLLSLVSDGFLRVEPRRGFVVAALAPRDIEDAYAAQALLAGELAARAATQIRQVELEQLSVVQAELAAASARSDLETHEARNHDFHRRIYAIADAPKLLWLLRSTLQYAPRRSFASIPGWPAQALRQHDGILAALAQGDRDAARQAMADHITEAGRLLSVHLKAPPARVSR